VNNEQNYILTFCNTVIESSLENKQTTHSNIGVKFEF
jgi:hypothetical protein